MRSTVGPPCRAPGPVPGPAPSVRGVGRTGSSHEWWGAAWSFSQAVAGSAPAVAATTSSQGVGISPNVAVVADASVT
jgi:hypothetical protein